MRTEEEIQRLKEECEEVARNNRGALFTYRQNVLKLEFHHEISLETREMLLLILQ